MQKTIKFKAMTLRGKTVYFTKKFQCPDFKVIPGINFKGIQLPDTTVESQIIDWLDNQNKFELMVEMDLGCIINYWIPEKKKAKPTIIYYLKQANLSEQMLLDLIAVYKEIKPILKGKSIETQIDILLSHLKVGYKSATVAYKRIADYVESDGNEELNILKLTEK